MTASESSRSHLQSFGMPHRDDCAGKVTTLEAPRRSAPGWRRRPGSDHTSGPLPGCCGLPAVPLGWAAAARSTDPGSRYAASPLSVHQAPRTVRPSAVEWDRSRALWRSRPAGACHPRARGDRRIETHPGRSDRWPLQRVSRPPPDPVPAHRGRARRSATPQATGKERTSEIRPRCLPWDPSMAGCDKPPLRRWA